MDCIHTGCMYQHRPAESGVRLCNSLLQTCAGCTGSIAGIEPVPATLALQCLPENALMEAACAAAGQAEELQLLILVQPSTAPADVVLMLDDTQLVPRVLDNLPHPCLPCPTSFDARQSVTHCFELRPLTRCLKSPNPPCSCRAHGLHHVAQFSSKQAFLFL